MMRRRRVELELRDDVARGRRGVAVAVSATVGGQPSFSRTLAMRR